MTKTKRPVGRPRKLQVSKLPKPIVKEMKKARAKRTVKKLEKRLSPAANYLVLINTKEIERLEIKVNRLLKYVVLLALVTAFTVNALGWRLFQLMSK